MPLLDTGAKSDMLRTHQGVRIALPARWRCEPNCPRLKLPPVVFRDLDKILLLSKSEIKPTNITTRTGLALENIRKTWKLSENNAPEMTALVYQHPLKPAKTPFFRQKKSLFRANCRKLNARSHPNGQKNARKKDFFIDIIFCVCYTLK